MEKINVAIIDDHKVFADGVKLILSTEDKIRVVAVTNSHIELLEALQNFSVNVLITDINMPNYSGFKLVSEITEKYPNTKTLALSMHDETSVVSKILKAGAIGYLLKDTDKEELIQAVYKIANGEKYYSNSIKEALLDNLSKNENEISKFNIKLSEREIEVLMLIAKGLTQQEVADKLFISPHTVVFHKRNLLSKLNAKNAIELIQKAIDLGFL